jgi:16S rRNA (guanine966-N2)-methyltransferase
MRIIAGVAKGKTLLSPPERTRPTSDRAREGLFSSLISTFGTMEGINFLDLFAGSGAVGVEALSRGAQLVHAVEQDGVAADVARSNFALVKGAAGASHLFRMSASTFLNQEIPSNPAQYDIIFMDPPYELSNDAVTDLIHSISLRDLLKSDGLIAIERATKSNPFDWPSRFSLEKIRSYGQGSIFYGGYSASVLP